jgi:hypothetical protein
MKVVVWFACPKHLDLMYETIADWVYQSNNKSVEEESKTTK